MELFVTDLDGTLINKDRQVTKKSEEIINELIKCYILLIFSI